LMRFSITYRGFVARGNSAGNYSKLTDMDVISLDVFDVMR